MRLRWKLDEKQTGLSAIGAGPRGSWLHDGTTRYAHVAALGGGWRPMLGWYWVAGWESSVPHINTCGTPCATVEQAKKQAMAYVKKHLKTSDAQAS